MLPTITDVCVSFAVVGLEGLEFQFLSGYVRNLRLDLEVEFGILAGRLVMTSDCLY